MVVPEIDQRTFAARHSADDAVVIDVREPAEYASGHVPGARNLPLGGLARAVDELPRSRPVYVLCQSGSRSAKATNLLRSAGVDAINVAGGTTAWTRSGHPIEK